MKGQSLRRLQLLPLPPIRNAGLTLIEMMVTLLIGAFLMIGVVSIFSQSRTAFRTNDTIARMQENVRYALNTMQPDIRMAGNWGMHSVAALVTVPAGVTARCPSGAVVPSLLDPTLGIEVSNGTYNANRLCPAFGAFQPGTDVLVVRHASGAPTAPTNTVIQMLSSRVSSTVFSTGAAPAAVVCPAAPTETVIRTACAYDWETHAYYVSSSSSLGANVPSLRRKTLVNGVLQDQELIAGVENFQVQLGVDTDNNDTVDRYTNTVGLVTPGSANFIPAAKVLAVRVWLMFRAEQIEVGFVDGATYSYASVANFAPADRFRRALVSKTILIRNARGT